MTADSSGKSDICPEAGMGQKTRKKLLINSGKYIIIWANKYFKALTGASRLCDRCLARELMVL